MLNYIEQDLNMRPRKISVRNSVFLYLVFITILFYNYIQLADT